MNTLRADFDHPVAAVHQTRSPGRASEPVLGLEALAREVALAVDDALRLAGRAARERDQARVVRLELDGRRRLAGFEQAARRGSVSTVQPGRAAVSSPRLRSSATISFGDEAASRWARSWARSCSLHGERDRADPEAGDHRQHPFGAAADQRHDHVAAGDAAARESARARRALRSEPPRRSSTRAGRRRGRARPAPCGPAGRASTTSRAKFIPAASLPGA